jgi:hypothetical protein
VINFVTAKLNDGEPAVTNASSIISGTETELTNKLLQQLAIIAYYHKSNQSNSQSTSLLPPSTAEPKSGPAHSATAIMKKVSSVCWPTRVRILLSKDGEEWTNDSIVDTGLTDGTEVAELKIESALLVRKISPTSKLDDEDVRAVKYMRIVPTDWKHHSSSQLPAAMRVSVKCSQFTADSEEQPQSSAQSPSLSLSNANKEHTDSNTNIVAASADMQNKIIDLLLSAFDRMQESAQVTYQGLEFISSIEDVLKLRKQEENRKVGYHLRLDNAVVVFELRALTAANGKLGR